MAIGDTIPFTTIPWGDALFVVFTGIMLLAAILVVSMRDIIRCGLAMMVCFAGLAGIYVLAFEAVSVLLLAAVIGGVFLAKREGGN